MKIRIMSEMNAIKESYKQDIVSCVIISITGADDEVPTFNSNNTNIKDIYDMHFEDIDKPYHNYREPRAEDFKGLKFFIDKYKEEIDEIIVHCHAGISRSSGCASAVCQYLNIDDKFIWGSGKYIPNRLVYKLAREELGLITSEDDLMALFKMNDDIHEEIYKENEIRDMF